MSEESKLPSMYLLVKENPATETEQGSFQIAVASQMDAVNGFKSAGFRVFKLTEAFEDCAQCIPAEVIVPLEIPIAE